MANNNDDTSGVKIYNEEPWGTWWRRVLTPFISVHFVITMVVLYFWAVSLGAPLEAMASSYGTLSDTANAETAENAISVIMESTTLVSGLFTTVLGLVLGHYFGQRSTEAAEQALSEVQSAQEVLLTDLESEGDAVTELHKDLEHRNEALLEALEVLKTNAPNAEIEAESALGQLLTG